MSKHYSSSEKLETLESFNRLQEEEIKDHLRPIFSNNIVDFSFCFSSR